MKPLTVKQLLKAVKENEYILARFYYDNSLVGVNCKILRTKRIKDQLKRNGENSKTRYVSFMPCTFQEYITHKTPFL